MEKEHNGDVEESLWGSFLSILWTMLTILAAPDQQHNNILKTDKVPAESLKNMIILCYRILKGGFPKLKSMERIPAPMFV